MCVRVLLLLLCQVEDDNCNMAAHIEKNNTVISITWDTSMASR